MFCDLDKFGMVSAAYHQKQHYFVWHPAPHQEDFLMAKFQTLRIIAEKKEELLGQLRACLLSEATAPNLIARDLYSHLNVWAT